MITISESHITASIDGTELATLTRIGDHRNVSTYPHPLTYDQSATALMLAERLAHRHDDSDLLLTARREELAHG